MKFKFTKIVGLVLTLTVSSASVFAAANEPTKGKFRKTIRAVAGEYIVVLKDPSAGQDVSSISDRLSRSFGGVTKRKFSRALSGFAVKLSEASAQALSDDPAVEFVEENGIMTAVDVQYNPPWGLDRLDQHDLPLNSSYNNNGLNGTGVTVYVIDSGIRITHQEFEGRAYVGADYIGDGLNGTDGFGHGTHVAGTIGGRTYGVAKQVKLCSVRVLNTAGSGTWDQVIAGIDWVTGHHSGPSVANMSLEGTGSSSVDRAVRNSIASGVTYVVAAGNDNVDASTKSPARVAEAITVGATDSNDLRAYFSNYGSLVDLFAPGVGVLSAWKDSDTAALYADGTSMASPHVAGLAALHLQRFPNDLPAVVQTAIINNASLNKVVDAGAGSPNRLAFIESNPIANQPPTASVSIEGRASGDVVAQSTTVTIHFTANDVDGNLSGIRYNVWNATAGYYDNGGGAFVAEAGGSADLAKTLKLDAPGDWYFWTEAQDSQGAAANTTAFYSAFKVTVISVPNRAPSATIALDGHSSGDVVALNTAVNVHFASADADGNLSGIRYNIWCPGVSFDNNGGGFVAQPGSGGEVVKSVTLSMPGDWYFWTDAQDSQSAYNSSGPWTGGFKITVAASPNQPPTPTVWVENLTFGSTISRNSTIRVHYTATDPDGNLTGMNCSRWNSSTGYYDNDFGTVTPVSGSTAEIVKTFTLDTPGDWFFWNDVQDAQGATGTTRNWGKWFILTVAP